MNPPAPVRRWVLVVVLLYALALLAATWPAVYLSFGWDAFGTLKPKVAPAGIPRLFGEGGYWLWLAAMMAAQAALLAVPVDLAAARPVRRRSLAATAAASGLMMGLLAGSGLLTLGCLLQGDDFQALAATGLVALAFWAGWAVLFWRAGRAGDPCGAIRRFLLAGSILELLVAVPSHILVRRRDVCCADLGTFCGIAAGISVMLFSFGPGVLFLYAERLRRKRGGL